MRVLFLAALVWAGIGQACAQAAKVNVDAFVRPNEFNEIQISPDGSYLATTVPLEDRTGLAILRRADNKVLSSFTLGKNTHIGSMLWVSDTRLLITEAEKMGMLERPQPTGEIFAMDVGDRGPQVLVGWRSQWSNIGAHVSAASEENVAALSMQRIAGDPDHVIVNVTPYSQTESWTRADKMDVATGRRLTVARAPVRGARFYADNAGVVRFSTGSESDNISKLYYRANADADWALVNDEGSSGHIEFPLGFSADNQVAYLRVEQAQGPDAIVAFDTRSGQRQQVMRDAWADPESPVPAFGDSGAVVGAYVDDAVPHVAFFDAASAEARTYALLQAAFQGKAVQVTSTTRDGMLALVLVYADGDPGSFYLFDRTSKKATYLLSRRAWVDPNTMASTRVLDLKARDGLAMRGYLTLPKNREPRGLPLVVLPHGGPFTIYDTWGYGQDVQLLAAAGYAVLQVNYRGSGNYGRAFLQAGARNWGVKLQDDLTDATRWVTAQGIADPARVCLYGGSYGAYAALMGVAKEPALYRCAAGYVGVYDLPMMTAQDSRESKRLNKWTSDWLGTDKAQLAATSPNLIANRIKAPVFLAAGGEDQTAPIEHSKRMEAALKAAGVPVETLYYRTEGHGFYTTEHQRAFYTQLLAFLDRNIGQAAPGTALAN